LHEITVENLTTNDNSGEYLHLPLDPGSQNYCPNGLLDLEGEIDSVYRAERWPPSGRRVVALRAPRLEQQPFGLHSSISSAAKKDVEQHLVALVINSASSTGPVPSGDEV
jgi:hypothetical protein